MAIGWGRARASQRESGSGRIGSDISRALTLFPVRWRRGVHSRRPCGSGAAVWSMTDQRAEKDAEGEKKKTTTELTPAYLHVCSNSTLLLRKQGRQEGHRIWGFQSKLRLENLPKRTLKRVP